MPLFGPHRAFEIPGNHGSNPQAEDPRLRRRSVYSFPEALPRVSRDGPTLGRIIDGGGDAGQHSAPLPQATSPLPGPPQVDRSPALTQYIQERERQPRREDYRPSTGRKVGAAAIGAINAYLNPGQGKGSEAMRNIMDAPFNKAHGDWERNAKSLEWSAAMEAYRRGQDRQEAEAQRKQKLFELERQLKGKQIEGLTTPEQDQQQRAKAIEEVWPEATPEIKSRYILAGQISQPQRMDTNVTEIEWVDTQAQREGHRPGTPQYANRVSELRKSLRQGKLPTARQLSDVRERDVVKFARGALENASGDPQTAIEDIGWLVDQGQIPAELYDNITQSIRLQVRPIPGQEETGFSSEFGLGR